MDDQSVVGLGAGGGILALIIFFLIKYKKQIHAKCKSSCCETTIDIDEPSSQPK
jgi:cellobiose-specific phosphotransferase system component IIC